MIDLTSRLLYGVKVETYWKFEDEKNKTFPVETLTYDMLGYYVGDDEWYFRMHYRPFLRPMSSMTEDERNEYRKLGGVMSYNSEHNTWAMCAFTPEAYDWLNKKMFDYRGLIEKELAVKATEEMYK